MTRYPERKAAIITFRTERMSFRVLPGTMTSRTFSMAGEGIGQIRQAVRDGDSICKGCIQKKYAAQRTRQVLYYVGEHSSILQLQPQIALRINGNFHLTDVLVIKPPFLTGAHLGAGGPVLAARRDSARTPRRDPGRRVLRLVRGDRFGRGA